LFSRGFSIPCAQASKVAGELNSATRLSNYSASRRATRDAVSAEFVAHYKT
jgi:hypothetical protein